MPQGSLLGSLLYTLYTKELESIILAHNLSVHFYADDVQLYTCYTQSESDKIKKQIERCLQDIKLWIEKNFLKINAKKTQSITFLSRSLKNSKIDPTMLTINFDSTEIPNCVSAKVLGVLLTSNLSLSSFITKKYQTCMYHLKNLYHIRNCLPHNIRVMLVTNLILSQLDYCNAILANCSSTELKPLKKVLHSSVRFIFNLKRYEHITPYLYRLHFLPVPYRILYKLALLAYKIVYKLAPSYLTTSFHTYTPTTGYQLRIGPGRDLLMLQSCDYNTVTKNNYSKLVQTWNALPYSIRFESTQTVFKNKLKTHFFQQAFDC